MPDVASKTIAANSIKNNSIVTTVMKDGTYQFHQRGINEFVGSGELETKYTNRFDDPTFYTA